MLYLVSYDDFLSVEEGLWRDFFFADSAILQSHVMLFNLLWGAHDAIHPPSPKCLEGEYRIYSQIHVGQACSTIILCIAHLLMSKFRKKCT